MHTTIRFDSPTSFTERSTYPPSSHLRAKRNRSDLEENSVHVPFLKAETKQRRYSPTAEIEDSATLERIRQVSSAHISSDHLQHEYRTPPRSPQGMELSTPGSAKSTCTQDSLGIDFSSFHLKENGSSPNPDRPSCNTSRFFEEEKDEPTCFFPDI